MGTACGNEYFFVAPGVYAFLASAIVLNLENYSVVFFFADPAPEVSPTS